MDTVIYQQDEATPHCPNFSLEYLHHYAPGDGFISRRTDHPWPAHPLDLSVLNYLLWRYLKDTVHANNPRTIDALKNKIRPEIRNIHHEMWDRVITNFSVRVVTVIQRQGAWIEHIIKY